MNVEEIIARCGSLRKARVYLREESSKFGSEFSFQPIPAAVSRRKGAPIEAFRNNRFLVQVFDEDDKIPGMIRLSVIRTAIDFYGQWEEGISWEDLMEIKTGVGYGHLDAVEVFPRNSDIVNVANMRHLWVFPEPIPWKWGSEQADMGIRLPATHPARRMRQR